MKKIILLVLLFSLSSTTYVSAQSNETHKEQFQSTYNNLKILVATQKFQFIGETIFDGQKREKLNKVDNTININDSKFSGQLRAFKSTEVILNHEEELSDFFVKTDDETQQITIKFTVNGNSLLINIRPNGKAVLTTSKTNGRQLSWIGSITKL